MKSLTTTALLALFIVLPTSATAAQPSLQQSFSTCENVTDLPLAHDLFWLIPRGDGQPGKVTPAQFNHRHRASIVPGSLTVVPSFEGGRFETTRVQLVGQSFAAGLTPKAMTAFTCPEGCGIMEWTLEFGKLNANAKTKLTAWVRALPPGIEDEVTRPTITEDAKGNVSLVCDLTL